LYVRQKWMQRKDWTPTVEQIEKHLEDEAEVRLSLLRREDVFLSKIQIDKGMELEQEEERLEYRKHLAKLEKRMLVELVGDFKNGSTVRKAL
jgi:hypothetical protein